MSQVSGGDEAWAAHYSEEAAPPGALGPPGTALVILGAGGDLSKKKTYPALLLLYRLAVPPFLAIWSQDKHRVGFGPELN